MLINILRNKRNKPQTIYGFINSSKIFQLTYSNFLWFHLADVYITDLYVSISELFAEVEVCDDALPGCWTLAIIAASVVLSPNTTELMRGRVVCRNKLGGQVMYGE